MEGDCKSTAPLYDANRSASMPTSAAGVSGYVTATDSAPSTSRTEVGLALPSTSESSASDSVCTRMERLVQRRSEYGSAVEFEIEASKVHWSEVDDSSDDDEEKETDLEVYERLKQKWGNFFHDYGDSLVLREKIAEGGQAEIFNAEYAYPDSEYKEMTIVKVFKHGWALRDLEKQWPVGMLDNQSEGGWFWDVNASVIWGATLLKNGRFAFRMMRHWGDLRQLIDIRMQRNNNRLPLWKAIASKMLGNNNEVPPFTHSEEGEILLSIAEGMLELHEMNIIHKDLKASNVLLDTLHMDDNTYDNFDPVLDKFDCKVADYECSARVVGTGYWRAPEILQAVKNCNVKPHSFTKEVDVYSYAMTCYEVITGHIPFQDLRGECYNVVIEGRRPELPQHIDLELKELLTRCWKKNPSERPSFEEIVECLKKIYGMQSSDNEAYDDEVLVSSDEASDDESPTFSG
ncbi:hypothetical protein M758_5G179700 [Ceratodon purpureus]|nr:hypothetical protein M758_5G179700 [Ceratodon purpureus]